MSVRPFESKSPGVLCVNWFIYVHKSECNFSQMFIFQIVQLDLSVFFKCILYLFQYNHGSIRGRICVNLYTFTYL